MANNDVKIQVDAQQNNISTRLGHVSDLRSQTSTTIEQITFLEEGMKNLSLVDTDVMETIDFLQPSITKQDNIDGKPVSQEEMFPFCVQCWCYHESMHSN
jgi:hypothetical protein